MKNELVGVSVGIVCALVLIGTVMMPVIDEITTEYYTYTNDGMPFAEVDDDSHIILVTSSALTVDGVEIDQSLFPEGFSEFSIVIAESGFIRYVLDTSIRAVTTGYVTYSVTSGETVTISIDGDTATVSSSDTSISESTIPSVTHYIASDGDYTLLTNPVVSSDDIVYGAGMTSFSKGSVRPAAILIFAVWSGTIDSLSGDVLTWTNGSVYPTVVLDDITVTTTELEYDLYQIDSVVLSFVATDTDSTEYELDATYTYFLAPSEVQYENPDYIGDVSAPLLTVIPLITILAVLCAVTYAVIRNRD